jgi:hypothetical protein
MGGGFFFGSKFEEPFPSLALGPSSTSGVNSQCKKPSTCSVCLS